MLISYNWLKNYIDIDLTPYEVTEKLTMAGVESDVVEENWGNNWENIVVAKVVETGPFPGKENKLLIGKINIGDKVLDIVSADLTIKTGELLLAVPTGLSFGEINVETRNFGEHKSEAMLISGEELGWEDKSTILLRFGDICEPGTKFSELVDFPDSIIELEITPNRADCLSIIGVVRELNVILGGKNKIKLPETIISEDSVLSSELMKVFIDSPEMGPYYSGRYISNINIKPSSLLIQSRLVRSGIRAINNIVDVTNYVLIELGQPLHTFDADIIKEKTIRVRAAGDKEKIVLLDETERELNNNDLVIADANSPVALAGIMGGELSGVSDKTKDIILESAYFNPVSIRKTARRLGIQTDASYRFERGIDPEMVKFASNRASYLISKESGGIIHKNFVETGELPYINSKILLNYKTVNSTLGTGISKDRIKSILINIGCKLEEESAETAFFVSPSFRGDLSREIDLIEEVGRIFGYNNIPVTYPKISINDDFSKPMILKTAKVRDIFAQWGFSEVINYSFISPDQLDKLKLSEEDRRSDFIKIANPITVEQSIMRTTLLPKLLENIKTNFSSQFRDLKLFEIGKVFFNKSGNYQEENHLGLVLTGDRFISNWAREKKSVDFYDIKGVFESFFERINLYDLKWEIGNDSIFHMYNQVKITYNKNIIGVLGEVNPEILTGYKVKQKVYYGEMYLDIILATKTEDIKYKKISKFPAAERDLAFVMEKDFQVGTLVDKAKDILKDNAFDVKVFDVYVNDKLGDKQKSVALRFYLQDVNHTLSEEEIEGLLGKIIDEFAEMGVNIRS